MPDNNPQLNISPNATDEEKTKIYSDYFGLPIVYLKDKDVNLNILSKIPYEVSKSFDILAYEYLEENKPQTLKIAVGNPARLQSKAPAILSELKRQKGINIQLAVASRLDFDYLLNQYKKKLAAESPKREIDRKTEEADEMQKDSANQQTSIKQDNFVDLKNKIISYDVLTKFPEEVATRYKMVVFAAPTPDKIKVAVLDLNDNKIKEILDFVKGKNKVEIELYQTTPQGLEFALRGYRRQAPLPKIPLAKPISLDQKIEEEEVTPTIASQKPKVEPEKPLPLERITLIKPIETSQSTPEVKITEVKSSELRQGIGARESTIQLESVSDEAEKNLNKLLPQGVHTIDELERVVKGGFIPKTLAGIIYLAVLQHASDIHFEADSKAFRLRFRVDGLLKDILKLPLELQAPLISRIKILSKLKIDESRIPQDGRFEVLVKERDVDLRVSTLPTIHGEKAVLRILDKSSQLLNLNDLGISGQALKVLQNNINRPYGVILATGPTGSGKTTTLYSIINTINKPEINVITLEDPVEYEISGINQCQIKPKIGFGFADGLRSVLRQDPNIIMVGEIRDQETASMATHSALTGHLVLTTLHTNDAASALPRLINMGVEPFLITSAINCIIAQRLVRKICLKCKEEIKVPNGVVQEIKQEIEKSVNPELSAFKNKEIKFFHGKGCNVCVDGFIGRIGLYEILEMNEKIEDLAVKRAPATTIKEQAKKDNMLTMKEDGIIKAIKGITTIDEIMRVTSQ